MVKGYITGATHRIYHYPMARHHETATSVNSVSNFPSIAIHPVNSLYSSFEQQGSSGYWLIFRGSLPNCCGTSIHEWGLGKLPAMERVISLRFSNGYQMFFLFSARPNEEIVAIILKGDSKAFDVDVLKAFIKILPDNTEVSYKYQDLNSLCMISVFSSR